MDPIYWPRHQQHHRCGDTSRDGMFTQPGNTAVVELGDVVSVKRELSSFPVFRHNGKPAEMVTAELAGAFTEEFDISRNHSSIT